MRDGTAPMRGSVEAGALALQRVLALEGRDVLSRVELAASELDRFVLAPALALQLGAIREAVGELDTVLDKIERLANPERRGRAQGETRLVPVLRSIGDRLAPALAARGVRLEGTVEGAVQAVGLPEAVVERLVLLWLRTAIAALVDDGALEDAPAIRFELEGRDREDVVELVLRPREGPPRRRFALARAARVELDVALTEWNAEAVGLEEAGDEAMVLRLPAVARCGDA